MQVTQLRHFIGVVAADADGQGVGTYLNPAQVGMAQLPVAGVDARADLRTFYERALQLTPGHGGALRGMVNSLSDAEHPARIACLEQTLDLPGQALVLWAGHSPTLADIQRNAFDAVYVRPLN